MKSAEWKAFKEKFYRWAIKTGRIQKGSRSLRCEYCGDEGRLDCHHETYTYLFHELENFHKARETIAAICRTDHGLVKRCQESFHMSVEDASTYVRGVRYYTHRN
jgi:hypothetical protein